MIIRIRNSRCLVEGSTREKGLLEQILLIDTGRYNPRGGGTIIHKFYTMKGRSFPVGLLAKVIESPVVTEGNLKVELVDERTTAKVPKRFKKLTGIDYFDWQKSALEKMLASRIGLLHIATNGGKTIVMAGYLKTLENTNIRGIIITHSAEIHEQLYKTFKKHLGRKVGRLTSKTTDVRDRQFVVCMGMTLKNRIGDDPYVTKLFEEHKLLMADEAHHLTAKTWSDLFKESNACLRFGFSGTIPDPETFNGWKVMASGGRVLVRVRNADLIEAGVSAVPTVYMHERKWDARFAGFYNACLTAYAAKEGRLFRADGKWINTYTKMQFFREYQQKSFTKGVVNNKDRNDEIVRLVVAEKGKQTLLVTERIDHGHALADAFMAAGQPAVFIHGEAPYREQALNDFRNGKLRTLITSQILDEGVDIAGIEVLVMAGVMKCERALLQRTGRGLRKKTKTPNVLKIIDFMDSGNRYLERYSEGRKKVFEEEGFEVKLVR